MKIHQSKEVVYLLGGGRDYHTKMTISPQTLFQLLGLRDCDWLGSWQDLKVGPKTGLITKLEKSV